MINDQDVREGIKQNFSPEKLMKSEIIWHCLKGNSGFGEIA